MKMLFLVFGLVLLLLAGCTQDQQKKDGRPVDTVASPAAEPASVGEGDQKLAEDDIPPTLPEDEEDEKEFTKMVDGLG